MDSLLHIGTKVDRKTAINVAECISKIFASGKRNGTDQSTIVAALNILPRVLGSEASNMNISGCSFTNSEQ